MYTHPAIRDVQVVGVPDEKYGEEVCACVILKKGQEATDAELIEFVKNGLSRYKSPRYILRLSEFPMTASGKIQKYKLREMGVEKLNLRAAANIETAGRGASAIRGGRAIGRVPPVCPPPILYGRIGNKRGAHSAQ